MKKTISSFLYPCKSVSSVVPKSVKSVVAYMTKLIYKDLTYKIIGAAMEVHSVLGPGYLEAVYQNAMAREFELRKIDYEEQVNLHVDYKGNVIGEYRADYLVDEKVVVEIKAIKRLSEIQEAQLINYLKGTGYKVGLLIHFGAMSLEHKRRVL